MKKKKVEKVSKESSNRGIQIVNGFDVDAVNRTAKFFLRIEQLSGLTRAQIYKLLNWSRQRYEGWVLGERRLTIEVIEELKGALSPVYIPRDIFLGVCWEIIDGI